MLKFRNDVVVGPQAEDQPKICQVPARLFVWPAHSSTTTYYSEQTEVEIEKKCSLHNSSLLHSPTFSVIIHQGTVHALCEALTLHVSMWQAGIIQYHIQSIYAGYPKQCKAECPLFSLPYLPHLRRLSGLSVIHNAGCFFRKPHIGHAQP